MIGGNITHNVGREPSSELGALGSLMERQTLTQHESVDLRTGLAEVVYGIVQNHVSGEPLGAEEAGQLQFIRDQRDVGTSELTPGRRIADELVLGLLLDRYSSATGEAAPGYFEFDASLIPTDTLDAVLRNLTSPDHRADGRFTLRGELARIKHLTDSGDVAVPYHDSTGYLHRWGELDDERDAVQTHKLQSIRSGTGMGMVFRGFYRVRKGKNPPLTHVAAAAEEALIHQGVWNPELR